jgi:hypothetical protein
LRGTAHATAAKATTATPAARRIFCSSGKVQLPSRIIATSSLVFASIDVVRDSDTGHALHACLCKRIVGRVRVVLSVVSSSVVSMPVLHLFVHVHRGLGLSTALARLHAAPAVPKRHPSSAHHGNSHAHAHAYPQCRTAGSLGLVGGAWGRRWGGQGDRLQPDEDVGAILRALGGRGRGRKARTKWVNEREGRAASGRD